MPRSYMSLIQYKNCILESSRPRRSVLALRLLARFATRRLSILDACDVVAIRQCSLPEY